MEIQSLHRCAVGIDVHLNLLVVCVIQGDTQGNAHVEQRQFKAFKCDRRAMAEWIASFHPDEVVMESTGVYWKSPYAALEAVGIRARVVNAFHVSKVPGRKTDISDAQWLAMLARAGLLNASFIPPGALRQLRLIARYHERLRSMQAAEKNRILRVLGDGGVRLSAVVSDPHGVAASAITDVLLQQGTPQQAVRFAGRLRAPRDELLASIDGELTPTHILVANCMRRHVQYLDEQLAALEAQLLAGLKPYQWALDLLMTMPGIDQLAAAKILVEIGDEMAVFVTPSRLASWAGLCPGNHESAGKRKTGKTPKGNGYVRALLCQVAQAAVKTRCYYRHKFQALMLRRGFKKAIIAIAHHLIKTIFMLLSTKQPYADKSENLEELMVKRNAARWVRQLKKYHKLPQLQSV
jgi:transposase